MQSFAPLHNHLVLFSKFLVGLSKLYIYNFAHVCANCKLVEGFPFQIYLLLKYYFSK
jgi:hypothetical protein